MSAACGISEYRRGVIACWQHLLAQNRRLLLCMGPQVVLRKCKAVACLLDVQVCCVWCRLPWQLQLSLLVFSSTRLSVTTTTTLTDTAETLRVTPRVQPTKPRATLRERGRRPRATSRVPSTHKQDSRTSFDLVDPQSVVTCLVTVPPSRHGLPLSGMYCQLLAAACKPPDDYVLPCSAPID